MRIAKLLGGMLCLAVLATVLSNVKTKATASAPGFANFEGAQTHPIRISADRTRLFAVNTPNGTLSVFDLTQAGGPVLLDEIPVGLEPVSCTVKSDTEVWVVNQASNSLSIVNIATGVVIGTLNLAAASKQGSPLTEPEDVVFTNKQAFVSASRGNAIAVYEINEPHSLTKVIPVYGDNPRAMAVSPDGKTVYAAFALSGNATTIIPFNLAPPQLPPTNPALPPPPKVGLIVSATDPNWSKHITFKMPDNDVVAIDAAKLIVTGYYSGVGTINLGLAVNPTNGDLYVANTDALNLTHFETNLLSHYVNNRITQISASTGAITPVDLNPGIDYSVLPNSAALSTALSQPTDVVFDPSGTFMYVASFGTDRVAKVDPTGKVLSFVEVSQASGSGSSADPATKRGPRGLALNAKGGTLYSLNRISNTISIINTAQNAVTGEIPVGNDPTPANIKKGRGFLYDAKLSGNGTGSCASCHVDGDIDHLAWDLGDPAGDMGSTVQNGVTIFFHPMKGPMTTQTYHGLGGLAPYHWRGDKTNFQAFNAAFPGLMGAPSVSSSDMDTYAGFGTSIYMLPNPYENLDRSLPAQLAGGNPTKGQSDFFTVAKTGLGTTCNGCHSSDPGPGSSLLISLNNTQPLKIPQLRNIYQKLMYTKSAKRSIDGFGLDHDGHMAGLADFLTDQIFRKYTAKQKTDIAAFSLTFDTGTAPAVGYTITLITANVNAPPVQANWATLQSEAGKGNIDLVARGTIQNVRHGLMYQPASQTYLLDDGVTTYTQTQLQGFVLAGDKLSVMGMYPGTGVALPAALARKRL